MSEDVKAGVPPASTESRFFQRNGLDVAARLRLIEFDLDEKDRELAAAISNHKKELDDVVKRHEKELAEVNSRFNKVIIALVGMLVTVAASCILLVVSHASGGGGGVVTP